MKDTKKGRAACRTGREATGRSDTSWGLLAPKLIISLFWAVLGIGILPHLAVAQGLPEEEFLLAEIEEPATVASIGATMIGDQMYYTMALQPNFRFGKLRVGFDLLIHWNELGGIREEDWDDMDDIAEYIRYVSWARKQDRPLYARLGILNAACLGHGFIMDQYNNRTVEEVDGQLVFKKVVGTEFDINMEEGGIETVVNDMTHRRLLGNRLYIRPLKLFDIEAPVLKWAAVGVTHVTDTDPDPDITGDLSLKVKGFDIELPVIEKFMTLYYDVANITHYGHGRAYGLGGRLETSNLLFKYRFEYRNLEDNMIPIIFDGLYEIHRPDDYNDLEAGTLEKRQGWYGKVSTTISDMVIVVLVYENYDVGNPNLRAGLLLNEKFLTSLTGKRITCSATYDQKNMDKFTLKSTDTLMTWKLTVGISENVDIVYTGTQTYVEDEFIPGKLNPLRTTMMATQIRF